MSIAQQLAALGVSFLAMTAGALNALPGGLDTLMSFGGAFATVVVLLALCYTISRMYRESEDKHREAQREWSDYLKQCRSEDIAIERERIAAHERMTRVTEALCATVDELKGVIDKCGGRH